jgi:hypothetical protein
VQHILTCFSCITAYYVAQLAILAMLCARKRERNNVQVRSPLPEKTASIPTREREKRERSTSPVSRYSPPSIAHSCTPVEVSLSLEFRV